MSLRTSAPEQRQKEKGKSGVLFAADAGWRPNERVRKRTPLHQGCMGSTSSLGNWLFKGVPMHLCCCHCSIPAGCLCAALLSQSPSCLFSLLVPFERFSVVFLCLFFSFSSAHNRSSVHLALPAMSEHVRYTLRTQRARRGALVRARRVARSAAQRAQRLSQRRRAGRDAPHHRPRCAARLCACRRPAQRVCNDALVQASRSTPAGLHCVAEWSQLSLHWSALRTVSASDAARLLCRRLSL